MDWTVLVVDWNSLGPAKFYIVMMAYISFLLWWQVKHD